MEWSMFGPRSSLSPSFKLERRCSEPRSFPASLVLQFFAGSRLPRQCEGTMSLRTIFEQRLADAECALGELPLLPESDLRADVDELRHVVALRREELALLRKLRPET